MNYIGIILVIVLLIIAGCFFYLAYFKKKDNTSQSDKVKVTKIYDSDEGRKEGMYVNAIDRLEQENKNENALLLQYHPLEADNKGTMNEILFEVKVTNTQTGINKKSIIFNTEELTSNVGAVVGRDIHTSTYYMESIAIATQGSFAIKKVDDTVYRIRGRKSSRNPLRLEPHGRAVETIDFENETTFYISYLRFDIYKYGTKPTSDGETPVDNFDEGDGFY